MLTFILLFMVVICSVLVVEYSKSQKAELEQQGLRQRIASAGHKLSQALNTALVIKEDDKVKIESLITHFFIFHSIDEPNVIRVELYSSILTELINSQLHSDLAIRFNAFSRKIPAKLSKEFYLNKLPDMLALLNQAPSPHAVVEPVSYRPIEQNRHETENLDDVLNAEVADAIANQQSKRSAQPIVRTAEPLLEAEPLANSIVTISPEEKDVAAEKRRPNKEIDPNNTFLKQLNDKNE